MIHNSIRVEVCANLQTGPSLEEGLTVPTKIVLTGPRLEQLPKVDVLQSVQNFECQNCISSSSSFFKSGKPESLQSFFVGTSPQFWDPLSSSPLHPLNSLNVFAQVWAPGMDRILDVRSD